MAHSTVVGGSTAKRLINCPASVKLVQASPPQPTSSFAEEGTLLHEAAAWCLETDKTSEDAIGFTHNGLTITQELHDEKLKPALDALEELFDKYEVLEFREEQKVAFTRKGLAEHDVFGTTDVMAKSKTVTLVIDFKFGDGVMVSPEENHQLMFYAGAALEDKSTSAFFDVESDAVVLAIIQPSFNNPNGTLQEWTTTRDHIEDFVKLLEQRVYTALNDDTLMPTTGIHCKFCPAASTCKKKIDDAHMALRMAPDQLDTLGAAMALADELDAWIKEVRKSAHTQLELGNKVSGWKLVPKRASRSWIDEEDALDKVRKMKKLKLEEACTVKLLSPAQLEKVCKKKGIDYSTFEDYIQCLSSGTTIAREDDKRKEALNTKSLSNALNKLKLG